ncbi:MAG: CPBP family intramembrane metalloprotease [Sedimentisphaerales bacterium]|nr:CPBP family intramembrane metalloprotease [Sedimentisphaerales bacterium]
MFENQYILAETGFFQQFHALDIAAVVISVFGLFCFAGWLSGFAGGTDLSNSPVRRNNVPYYVPVIWVFIWMLMSFIAAGLSEMISGDRSEWVGQFLSFGAITIVEAGMIVILLLFAYMSFARRLKGFGLNVRTLHRDIFPAIVNFICVYPLVFAAVLVVDFLGRVLDPSFELQTNEGLSVLLDYPQLPLRILLIIFSIVIVPVFEEVLFRGLFQSMVRGYTQRPWMSVFITSGFFAMLHPWTHWPALFILSCCMGYAYEKSGSLFRSIFIHMLFNGLNVTAALLTMG